MLGGDHFMREREDRDRALEWLMGRRATQGPGQRRRRRKKKGNENEDGKAEERGNCGEREGE